MNLQTIKLNGQEFVLIPATCYKANKQLFDDLVITPEDDEESEYIPFVLEDYFKNPVALARIRRRITQKQLAKLLKCSQSYVSQLEKKDNVSNAVMDKVMAVLKNYADCWAKFDKDNPTVPHGVVDAMLKKHISRLQAWREYLGFSEKQIAKKLGISQTELRQIEALNAKPEKEVLRKLAEIYDVTLQHLR